MVAHSPAPDASPPLLPPSAGHMVWSDVALYIGVGFGTFMVTTLLIGAVIREAGAPLIAAISLANLLCLAGSVYVLGIRRRHLSWAELGLQPARWQWPWLLLVVGVTVFLIPLRVLVALAAQWLFEGGMESLQSRMQFLSPEFSWLNFAVTLLGVGVLVPFSEELFFRGALYTSLRRRLSVWPAVLFSAGLFGVAHFDSVGVAASSFIMGLVITLVMERTRSLWPAIAIHALNNSGAVISLYAVLALMERFPQLRP